ncbi:hypothetical protein [Pseudomonas sp.]|uniref:hypothetical protein n=1 Tax=Pseudomonas sp. TaxID=306 RepID=UPI003C718F5B
MIAHKVLLDGYDSPARPQGRRPTCLAFALSDLNRPRAPADLSPEFLYRAAAILNPAWVPGSGVTFDAMREASRGGQPEEVEFPYCTDEPSHPIPPLPSGLKHYGQLLQRVSADPTDIACLITAGQPIGLGLRVTREFFKPQDGVIPFSDQVMAGLLHAVVAIGYNIATPAAIIPFIQTLYEGAFGVNEFITFHVRAKGFISLKFKQHDAVLRFRLCERCQEREAAEGGREGLPELLRQFLFSRDSFYSLNPPA